MANDIEVIEERIAEGRAARKGSMLAYSARFFLNRGDEVTPDHESIRRYGAALSIRIVEDVALIEHQILLGKRRAIAGVERALVGMSAGSYREVLIPPQLAYGANGLGDLIPPNALLRAKLWVHVVRDATGSDR